MLRLRLVVTLVKESTGVPSRSSYEPWMIRNWMITDELDWLWMWGVGSTVQYWPCHINITYQFRVVMSYWLLEIDVYIWSSTVTTFLTLQHHFNLISSDSLAEICWDHFSVKLEKLPSQNESRNFVLNLPHQVIVMKNPCFGWNIKTISKQNIKTNITQEKHDICLNYSRHEGRVSDIADYNWTLITTNLNLKEYN